MPSEHTIENWFEGSDDRDEMTADGRLEIITTLEELADSTRDHFDYHEEMRRAVQRLIN